MADGRRRGCAVCKTGLAALKRPKTGQVICKECFFTAIEDEVHRTIVDNQIFSPGERVAIGASGGKDSTVLAHLLSLLNKRHGYGLDLMLVSVDEGIAGYRDDSLETVKRNEKTYGIPLRIVSYKDLYGWTMDEIVARIGRKNNCTFCGVFRRRALDRGAEMVGAAKIATGHNADDIAETVLLNLLRGDVARLGRCTSAVTGGDDEEAHGLPRVKPFRETYEKEIVMYAYFKRLDYFTTECLYAPFAARGHTRDLVKELEAIRPRVISDIVRSGAALTVAPAAVAAPKARRCARCGFLSSQTVCKACLLLDGLDQGDPTIGVRRQRRGQRRDGANGAASDGAVERGGGRCEGSEGRCGGGEGRCEDREGRCGGDEDRCGGSECRGTCGEPRACGGAKGEESGREDLERLLAGLRGVG